MLTSRTAALMYPSWRIEIIEQDGKKRADCSDGHQLGHVADRLFEGRDDNSVSAECGAQIGENN